MFAPRSSAVRDISPVAQAAKQVAQICQRFREAPTAFNDFNDAATWSLPGPIHMFCVT
jgi:hypothetical protein